MFASVTPVLRIMAQYWRESLIVILITSLAFMGWYYEVKTNNFESDLLEAKTNYTNAKANATLLEFRLDDLITSVDGIEEENKELEDAVAEAKIKIEDLQSNPITIVKTVYEQVLPEQCFGKFEWMLGEAIRMQGDK